MAAFFISLCTLEFIRELAGVNGGDVFLQTCHESLIPKDRRGGAGTPGMVMYKAYRVLILVSLWFRPWVVRIRLITGGPGCIVE